MLTRHLSPFLIIIFFAAACAQPKYLTKEQPQKNSDEKTAVSDKSAGFAQGDLFVSFKWIEMPTDEAEGSALIRIWRANLADGSPVPVDPLGLPSAVLWMPSMNHGSSPVSVERLDIGTFKLNKIYFTMRGDWEVRVQIESSTSANDKNLAKITLSF